MIYYTKSFWHDVATLISSWRLIFLYYKEQLQNKNSFFVQSIVVPTISSVLLTSFKSAVQSWFEKYLYCVGSTNNVYVNL